jgi:hypothetical protein
MRIKNYEWVWNKINEVFGDGAAETIKSADKDSFRMVAAKIELGLLKQLEEVEGSEKIKGILTQILQLAAEGKEVETKMRADWEDVGAVKENTENLELAFEERCKALKWISAEKAVDLVKHNWGEKEDMAAGVATMLDLAPTKAEAEVEFQKWREGLAKSAQNQSNKIGWIKELAPDFEWDNLLEMEETDGCRCFYTKDDGHRFIPVITFFPGLTEEEVNKVNEMMEGNLPNDYREFLRQANGIAMAGIFEWWGVRKFYNEKKHLAQYFSLINGRVDEQMLQYLGKSETIIASDKYHNIYTMDVITGEVKGLVRPQGDEMSTPQKVSYKNLGDLLAKQLMGTIEAKDF